jgi:exopolysaccharide biosynthesis WecB/TagA/CpsF family protein
MPDHARETSRLKSLLDRLHIVPSNEPLAPKIAAAVIDRPFVVSFFNQHAFNLAADNEGFYEDLRTSDMLLRDGVGLEICLKLLGRTPGPNANGTDLIPQILLATKHRRIAVFGTSEPWLSKAVEQIASMTGPVVAAADGFRDHAYYQEVVTRLRPDVVVLAMGMPRQERLAAVLAEEADWPLLIINGGAILDFMARRFARAPKVVRAVRMEWLFRLLQEPARLGQRYVVGGAAFGRRVMLLWMMHAAERRR